MTSLVLIDGRPMPPDEAKVSVFDRGFLYGDSVFEALRTYGGRPFALDRHLARLAASAARVFIDLPVSLAQIGREVESAIVGAGNAESYVRLTITRGVGDGLGLDPGLARHALRVVIVTPLKSPPAETYRDGVAVGGLQTVSSSITITTVDASDLGLYQCKLVSAGGVVLWSNTARLKLTTGAYGSTFFMLTGFHGFHVTVGAIMLSVIFARCLKGHFKPDHHFAFEGVAWYWHFVDVVWLGLFIFVYWL